MFEPASADAGSVATFCKRDRSQLHNQSRSLFAREGSVPQIQHVLRVTGTGCPSLLNGTCDNAQYVRHDVSFAPIFGHSP
jgi:hypothetical protein